MDGSSWWDTVPESGRAGVYVTVRGHYQGADTDGRINALSGRYKESVGEYPPSSLFVDGYGAIEMLAVAIQSAGTTDGAAVTAELEKLRGFDRIAGPATFTAELHDAPDRAIAILELTSDGAKLVDHVKARRVPKYADIVDEKQARIPAMSLNADNITMALGALVALRDIILTLDRGEILGLIGPNGAGKTAVVNIISGFQRMSGGAVSLDSLSPQARSRNGVVRTFQGARIFSSMTVLENAMVGALAQGASDREARERAHAALSRLGLRSGRGSGQPADLRAGARTGSCPRALHPAALSAAGRTRRVHERKRDRLAEKAVRAVRDDLGIGVMLIEHDMSLVMSLCDRVQVLVKGETLTVGRPAEVQRNKDVLASDLGSAGEVAA